MSELHDVLLVEDDVACAENLREILDSIGCKATCTDNAEAAVRLVDEGRHCLIVLDLAIKKAPKSLKGHAIHGLRVLEQIESGRGSHAGLPMWTPVVVVSGNANEPDDVITMMRDAEVDDIIRKPIRIADTKKRLLRALEKAGRAKHSACLKRCSTSSQRGVPIEITGKRDKRKVVVRVAETEVGLPESSLKMLLELALATAKGGVAHKQQLGRYENPVKRISQLRAELKVALGHRGEIVTNDGEGGYALRPDVRVSVDLAGLEALGKAEITRIAVELVAVAGTGNE